MLTRRDFLRTTALATAGSSCLLSKSLAAPQFNTLIIGDFLPEAVYTPLLPPDDIVAWHTDKTINTEHADIKHLQVLDGLQQRHLAKNNLQRVIINSPLPERFSTLRSVLNCGIEAWVIPPICFTHKELGQLKALSPRQKANIKVFANTEATSTGHATQASRTKANSTRIFSTVEAGLTLETMPDWNKYQSSGLGIMATPVGTALIDYLRAANLVDGTSIAQRFAANPNDRKNLKRSSSNRLPDIAYFQECLLQSRKGLIQLKTEISQSPYLRINKQPITLDHYKLEPFQSDKMQLLELIHALS